MSNRPLLERDRMSSDIVKAMSDFHPDVLKEVQTAIDRDAVVVVGMAQNPWVRKVRQSLNEAGIQFTYLEYGSYLSQWKRRLAIKLWSGWPTFPQVFVRGRFIGGAIQTQAAIADGSIRALASASPISAQPA